MRGAPASGRWKLIEFMRNTFILLAGLAIFSSFANPGDEWLVSKQRAYQYYFKEADQARTTACEALLNTGIETVERFFDKPFPKSFDVYVRPTRRSWDQKLQKAYQMPDFQSECWMVASGDGFQLNMISPATRDTASCEHKYSDKVQTQQLLTHELFHGFHGQHNPSQDFMDYIGLDWFAEGFATYASGQLTDQRMTGVKKLAAEGKAPTALDDFWVGQYRYRLSGSMVKFLDSRFGREALFTLLKFKTKADLLSALNTSEQMLLEGWRKSITTN